MGSSTIRLFLFILFISISANTYAQGKRAGDKSQLDLPIDHMVVVMIPAKFIGFDKIGRFSGRMNFTAWIDRLEN